MDLDVLHRDVVNLMREAAEAKDRAEALIKGHADHEARLTAIEAALTAPKPKANDGNDQRGREARSGATGAGREDR